MANKTITLYTMAWGGYWQTYGESWSSHINKLNSVPDEIIVVSDKPIDVSDISITKNIKNIVKQPPSSERPMSFYKNLAIEMSSCDWVVGSDLDDRPFANYLDNLDDDADIHAFSFIESAQKYFPNGNSLEDRLRDRLGSNVIPGTSAIKKKFLNNIRYENDCYEDLVFYSMAYYLKPKLAFDKNIRFEYSGFHSHSSDLQATSSLYKDMLTGLNRQLFVCWFSNTITDSRKSALRVLARSSMINVRLITNNTFYDYETQDLPIHPGFPFLSDVHKSDYARAYLMYLYGGGYSDIKASTFDWNPYFDQLLSSRHDAIGASEAAAANVANFWGNDIEVEAIVHNRYSEFASCGSFIFKPRTSFAYDWITSIHKIMDDKYEQLKDNPGLHPYAISGGIHASYLDPVPPEMINASYPFTWTEIGGSVRHKLEYEHGLDVFKKGMPPLNTQNYR